MLLAVVIAIVAIAAVAIAFNAMLDRVLQRVALERAADRAAFAGERDQWLQERQLLLTRVVDPPAGTAQALMVAPSDFDPSEYHGPPLEMPDFPGQGERTLT